MALLEQLHRGKRKRPRKQMIYGTGGIGKSELANKAPRSVFIATEDRHDHIDCYGRFPLCRDLAGVQACVRELYTGEHDFKTCIIDSLDWLERFIWTDAARARNIATLEEVPYKNGYAYALPYWSEFIAALDALRNERDMNILVLAHYEVEKVKLPDQDTFSRYSPKLHKLACELWREWCDEVLFATYDVHTTKVNEGFGATRTQAYGSERVLKTTETATHIAKNSLGLTPVIKLPAVNEPYPAELQLAA
jgi:hypothetical protein